MSRENKTAIISIGGGMRSAYGAGFLYALGTQLGITRVDIVVASSGGTGSALYYITGQYEDIRRIWCDALPTRRFISWIRVRPIMDIDYLVDDVLKKQSPLKTELLITSTTRFFIPLLDMSKGCVRMVNKEDGVDPYELLRASKSMPFFFGKSVLLLEARYTDGGIAVVLSDMIDCAREQGARKILVINNRTQLNTLKRWIFIAYAYMFASHGDKTAILQWIHNHKRPLDTADATCLILEPRITMWTATRNQKKVRAIFQMGINDALARAEELRTLLA